HVAALSAGSQSGREPEDLLDLCGRDFTAFADGGHAAGGEALRHHRRHLDADLVVGEPRAEAESLVELAGGGDGAVDAGVFAAVVQIPDAPGILEEFGALGDG